MGKDQIYPSKGNPDREPDQEGSTEFTGGPMKAPSSWVDFHRSNPKTQAYARGLNAAHIRSSRAPLTEDLNMKNARNPAFANPPSAEKGREMVEGLSSQYGQSDNDEDD